jgi:hypothetical protein
LHVALGAGVVAFANTLYDVGIATIGFVVG